MQVAHEKNLEVRLWRLQERARICWPPVDQPVFRIRTAGLKPLLASAPLLALGWPTLMGFRPFTRGQSASGGRIALLPAAR